MDEVRLLLKLPDWFEVPTPIGASRPDWAIVFQHQDAFGQAHERLYLVCETKGSTDEAALRLLESLRIDCARAHFGEIEVPYEVATNAEGLRQALLTRRAP